MKTVTEDPYEFYKEGGWDFLQTGENGSDASDDEESEAESTFDPVSIFPNKFQVAMPLSVPTAPPARR